MTDTDRTKAKKTSGGNSRVDQEWFLAIMEEGELQPPIQEHRPKDFLYEVNWQWKYSADEVNVDFFEESRKNPNMRKCNATAFIRDPTGMYIVDCDWVRLQRPCLAHASPGTTVCKSHGGLIPAVRAAAERTLVMAAEVVAERLVGLTGPRDEEDERVAHKDRISASNSVLDRAGIKGGVEIEVKTPGYQRVMEKLFDDEDQETK